MKFAILILNLVFLCSWLHAGGTEILIDPDKALIVAEPRQDAAAADLKKHLDLIAGKPIPLVSHDQIKPGSFVFYVGRSPAGSDGRYQPEEARWEITPKTAYFYGDKNNGTLYAVYDFLENELGVRWPAPEDIAFKHQNPIRIRNLNGRWLPELNIRKIRSHRSKPLLEWHSRLRSGGHDAPSYGHGFTRYWTRFSKTHPEFFAMRKDGIRAPAGAKVDQSKVVAFTAKQASMVSMCVSCDSLIRQIIADWKARRCPLYINLCENDADGKNVCHCPKCKALDVKPAEKSWWENCYADRYIHFANRVLSEARKIRPDVKATMYAYNATERAPAREKPHADLVIGIVPTDFTMEGIQSYVNSWKKAGVKRFFYRPNRHCYYKLPYLPTGSEKHFFNVWKFLFKSGAIGFDYDVPAVKGDFQCFGDYVLLKAMQDPTRSFEYWEKHYMQAFGDAADDVAGYYRYWREQVWQKRLVPDQKKITDQGRYFNFARGLIWNLGKYYRDSDFIEAAKYLEAALSRNLTPAERARIGKLKLSHEHSRLFFRAAALKNDQDSIKLLEFRRQHKIDPLPWNEQYFGDVCGIKRVMNFKDYKPPYLKMPLFWYFRLDPENKGVAEKWYENTLAQVKNWGALMSTNSAWETPHKGYKQISAEIRKKTAHYDGIAWYATVIRIPADWKDRKIFLYFGAVDESCWVYLNGKEIASRIFKKNDDWSTPFALQINSGIDWNRKIQLVIIRVEDTSGQGGIRKPVWLVSK